MPSPGRTRRRRWSALLATALLALVLVGCGDDDAGASDRPESTSSAAAGDTTTSTAADDGEDDAPDQRIVALGEERLLADLLAVGIRPVASSANVVVDGGFVGLDGLDTTGIEAMVSHEPNLELLASLRPDVIVANEFAVDNLGRSVLEGMAELVVIPNGDGDEQLLAAADAFDRRAEAEALLDDLDAALADGRDALAGLSDDDRVVSVSTIYAGDYVAAWVGPPVDIPATLIELGFTLRPDADELSGPGGATGGRVYLSPEQIGVLDAPRMVAMQSVYVEGEDEAIAAMAADPLWSGLPAVAAGRVVTVERLGYPGIVGRIRLVDDLVELLGGAS